MENSEQVLFKYQSVNVARIVLENRTLRWNTPQSFNDPFDIQFDLHVDIDFETVKRKAVEKLWETYRGAESKVGNSLGVAVLWLRKVVPDLTREQFEVEMNAGAQKGLNALTAATPRLHEELRELMRTSKVLCLTNRPDSLVMWAYYGENHKGVVLRFKSLTDGDSPWRLARPVEYVRNMPQLFDAETLSDIMSGRASIDAKAQIHKLVFSKSLDWSHEREWRIFTGNGRFRDAPHEDIPFAERELDSVILGCRMTADSRREIINLVRRNYPFAHLVQCTKEEKSYGLRFEAVK